jgi:hypothetical protein
MKLSDKRFNIFLSKIRINSEGCWVWRGTIDVNGYGKIIINKKQLIVSRVAYLIFNGIDLEHYYLDFDTRHFRCHNPSCVNPFHLKIGTRSDNMKDSVRDKTWANQNSRKIICIRGHPLNDTYINSRGERVCKRCNTIRCTKYQRRKNKEEIVRKLQHAIGE